VVAPTVVIRAAEAVLQTDVAVLQMDVAEIAQATDHLLVQEADAVVLQTDVAVFQMDVAEIAQATDYLLVQEADAVVLQTDIAFLQMDAVLQAMEDVAAKKVVLLQADKFCIETIKKNRASALFFLSHDFLKNILWQQKPQPVQMVRKKAANWKNFSLIS